MINLQLVYDLLKDVVDQDSSVPQFLETTLSIMLQERIYVLTCYDGIKAIVLKSTSEVNSEITKIVYLVNERLGYEKLTEIFYNDDLYLYCEHKNYHLAHILIDRQLKKETTPEQEAFYEWLDINGYNSNSFENDRLNLLERAYIAGLNDVRKKQFK